MLGIGLVPECKVISEGEGGAQQKGPVRFGPAEAHGSIGILTKPICNSTGWTRAVELIGHNCSC